MNRNTINLKNVVVHSLINWKMWVIMGVVFALVCTYFQYDRYTYVMNYNANLPQVTDTEELPTEPLSPQDYESYAEYLDTKATLETEIAALNTSIATQEEYLRDSIYINMDANSVYESAMNIPIVGVESETGIAQLAREYTATFAYGDYYDRVNTEFELNSNVRYVKELTSIGANAEQQSITLVVRTNDEELNEKIMLLAIEYIKEEYEDISENIIEHTLHFGDIITNNIVFPTLQTAQADKANLLTTDKNSLLSKQQQLEILSPPEPTEDEDDEDEEEVVDPTIPLTFSRRTALVLIVAAGIGGVLFWVVCVLVYMIITNKLTDEQYVSRENDMQILVKKPYIANKANIIDKNIYRVLNKTSIKNNNEFFDYISNYINNVYSSETRIHLTGSVKTKELEGIMNNLKLKNGIEVTYGSCVMENAKSLQLTCEADKVVLVEKMYKSSATKLDDEIKFINNIGKHIDGVILI